MAFVLILVFSIFYSFALFEPSNMPSRNPSPESMRTQDHLFPEGGPISLINAILPTTPREVSAYLASTRQRREAIRDRILEEYRREYASQEPCSRVVECRLERHLQQHVLESLRSHHPFSSSFAYHVLTSLSGRTKESRSGCRSRLPAPQSLHLNSTRPS